MSANFIFQPKPEGDRHIQVHISYKRITDGKESTAALLSVLEYLAKQSLLNSGSWSIGDPIPEHIPIQGDCNNPRLNRLLDGWLKPTALRGKLQYFEGLGFISLDTNTNHRRRFVIYHYGAIASALTQINLHPPKYDPSLSDSSKSETSESEASKRVALVPKTPKNGPFPQPLETVGSKKCGLTPQKVEPHPSLSEASEGFRPQKVDPSRSLNPDLLAEQKEDQSAFSDIQSAVQSDGLSKIQRFPQVLDQESSKPVENLSSDDSLMSQAEFELLSPAQQQVSRLKGDAIALDPWIIDNPCNQSNVLAGRAFRCGFDADFTQYLWKQLGQSPYWQKRSDDPPKNAGIRMIKALYAIADPAGRDAQRERLMGEWDKYQAIALRQQQNQLLRQAPSVAQERSGSLSDPSEDAYVPLSQMPQEVQELFARFRRSTSPPVLSGVFCGS
ncbi:MAG: hypothetical protein AAGD25_15065 [Cyanobacteria bacterium P01_F01_bin.150]